MATAAILILLLALGYGQICILDALNDIRKKQEWHDKLFGHVRDTVVDKANEQRLRK